MTVEIPISRDEFITFLLEAKRRTYAAEDRSASVPALLPQSHQLEYRSGDFFYRDIYFGGNYFVGQETVYYQEAPLWAMVYAGGALAPEFDSADLGKVYAFLQAALRQARPERPFRGPQLFQQAVYTYRDEGDGDVARFAGKETIWLGERPVYALNYCGGFIR